MTTDELDTLAAEAVQLRKLVRRLADDLRRLPGYERVGHEAALVAASNLLAPLVASKVNLCA